MMKPKHYRRRRILTHILNHACITRDYALAVFHVQNLAQVIMELRRMGWVIGTYYHEREDRVKTVCYYISQDARRRLYREGKVNYHVGRRRYEPVLG